MKNEPLVVVLDTNIYLSGIFWRGLPHRVLEMARKREYLLFATEEILEEIEKKMVEKLEVSPIDADLLITGLKAYVNLAKTGKQIRIIKSDPDDDKFINCALGVNAKYIVSGDHHLLDLREYQGIKIVNAREFLKILETN